SHIKVMKEVCEKYQVVTPAVIDLEDAARDCAIAIIYSRFQSILPCYGENALPINCNHFSSFVALNPIHSMTGSNIQHLQLLFRPLSTSLAIFFAGTAVIGAIARANLTHT